MNRLILNTANEDLTIVLKKGDEVFATNSNSNQHHNETMLPLIDELLKINKLDISEISEFGVVIGPGSFTGIRVGIATIKAFRDCFNAKAKGINNLDYLYNLAKSQNSNINIVAILGSKDSYFVARNVNGNLHKYERVLTLNELKSLAGDEQIGMFTLHEGLNVFKVNFDANILDMCFDTSEDYDLIPKYYQLSQAESEKMKKGNLEIVKAVKSDLDCIAKLESENIKYNTISLENFQKYIDDANYQILVAKFNNEVVGFILLEITDEINISSIAVDKDFRNLGIASKLIESAKTFTTSKNINVLSLEVSVKNTGAFLLYDKLGFKQRRIRKSYYQDGADCIEMSLQIK